MSEFCKSSNGLFKFSNVKYSAEKQEWEEFEVSENVKNVTEIMIPRGTRELENYACYGCEKVKKIYIPHTVNKIGIAAFANCKELEEINIPSNVVELPNDVFYNCVNLKYLTISPNLKEVSKTALLNCQSLKVIYIACDNFNTYAAYAESIKNKDIKSKCEIKWKYLYTSKTFFSTFNFTTIPNYDKCSYLVIPRGIKKLESCKNASKLEIVSSNINSKEINSSCLDNIELGEFVFEGCNKLKNIKVGNVPRGGFKNCKGLKNVEINGNVGESGFEGCNKLEEVKFIDLQVINEKVEVDVEYLNEVEDSEDSGNSKEVEVEELKDNSDTSENLKQMKLKENETNEIEKMNELKELDETNEPKDSKEPAKYEISKYSFKDCRNLKKIDLSLINKLSESAFENCYFLSEVILPNVSFIPKNCFKSCFNLISIIFPDSVRKIEESAFENCYKLEEIDLRFIKIIEKYVFKECFNLKELKSDQLKLIDESAFEKCIALKKVDITSNKIKTSAFEWCINLESVSVSNIKQIEPFAFAHCLKLKDMIIKGELNLKIKNKQSKIFEDTPLLSNIQIISDSNNEEDINEIKNKLKKDTSIDFKLSDELQRILKEIEDNKLILKRLNEDIDYAKYSTNSPRFILDIQRKTISNKMKLIETKNEEMQHLKEINKDNLNDIHDKAIEIQTKLSTAMKEYETNKTKINELKEEFDEE